MTLRILAPLLAALALLSAAATARAGDCYNDEATASSDLEPPPPGGVPETLRITDDDLARMLARIADHEKRRAATTAPAQPPPRPVPAR